MTFSVFSNPNILTNRRNLLVGAIAAAGFSNTAQPASSINAREVKYKWTAPDWGEEHRQFNVIERGEDTTIVKTMDGTIEIPSSPQRVVSLGDEYVPLFELGVDAPIVGLGQWGETGSPISAGDLTQELLDSLKDLPIINLATMTAEEVESLDPDLILANSSVDYGDLPESVPVIRTNNSVRDTPRAMIRDFGALFGLDERASELLSQHDEFVELARENLSPFVDGLRTLVGYTLDNNDSFRAIAAYWDYSDQGVTPVGLTYPFFRELGMTPTDFVESNAESSRRETPIVEMTMDEVVLIDADFIFMANIPKHDYDNSLTNPKVQSNKAFQSGNIYHYDNILHGAGLSGVRSAIHWIVESITGDAIDTSE